MVFDPQSLCQFSNHHSINIREFHHIGLDNNDTSSTTLMVFVQGDFYQFSNRRIIISQECFHHNAIRSKASMVFYILYLYQFNNPDIASIQGHHQHHLMNNLSKSSTVFDHDCFCRFYIPCKRISKGYLRMDMCVSRASTVYHHLCFCRFANHHIIITQEHDSDCENVSKSSAVFHYDRLYLLSNGRSLSSQEFFHHDDIISKALMVFDHDSF